MYQNSSSPSWRPHSYELSGCRILSTQAMSCFSPFFPYLCFAFLVSLISFFIFKSLSLVFRVFHVSLFHYQIHRIRSCLIIWLHLLSLTIGPYTLHRLHSFVFPIVFLPPLPTLLFRIAHIINPRNYPYLYDFHFTHFFTPAHPISVDGLTLHAIPFFQLRILHISYLTYVLLRYTEHRPYLDQRTLPSL